MNELNIGFIGRSYKYGYYKFTAIKEEPKKTVKKVRFNLTNITRAQKEEKKKDKYIYIEDHRFILVE